MDKNNNKIKNINLCEQHVNDCTHDEKCLMHSGLITTYGDYPFMSSKPYFMPMAEMGERPINKFGMQKSDNDYTNPNILCNRIYKWAVPMEKCHYKKTDDIRRNYPEEMAILRRHRTDEYFMYNTFNDNMLNKVIKK